MLDARAETAATLRKPDWYKSATCWTQLTLAEDDPIRFDPDWWIDLFQRTRSNATCLSAGGYVVQVTDNPGRQEPGTGEINYARVFEALDRLGYDGFVGAEYRPAAGTSEGLGWMASCLGRAS